MNPQTKAYSRCFRGLFLFYMKKLHLVAKQITDLGKGVIRAVVATDSVDRHGEVLNIDGLDISKYMLNPVVGWGHRYDMPAVAKTISLEKVMNNGVMQLVATMEFAIEISDLARQLYELYKGEFMRAFSIGFIPKEESGNEYTRSEMLEYSCVFVPANAEALTLAVSKGIDFKTVQKDIEANPEEVEKKPEVQPEQKPEETEKPVDQPVTPTEPEGEDVSKNIKKGESFMKPEELAAFLEAQKKQAEALEAMQKKIEAMDAPVVKDIAPAAPAVPDVVLSKEEKLKLWVEGAVSKNFSNYLAKVKDVMTTTNSSAVLPPTEFIAEVLRLENEYGVARRFAKVRSTNRTSVTMVVGSDDMEVYDTAEGGVKKGVKTAFSNVIVTLRKFAGVAPLTEELLEDSAVDLWNELTGRFARAFTKKEDTLMFTDPTSGITNIAGTNVVRITGDSIEDITFDDINKAMYGVPAESMANGKFYFNSTILGVLQRIKDLDGNYILKPGVDGLATGTLWGRPYVLTEIMPSLQDDAADKAFIVFGDLKNSVLVDKNGMKLKVFDAGVVVDSDEEDVNLITQDCEAMRGVKRMNAKTVFARAYSVIKTSVQAS